MSKDSFNSCSQRTCFRWIGRLYCTSDQSVSGGQRLKRKTRLVTCPARFAKSSHLVLVLPGRSPDSISSPTNIASARKGEIMSSDALERAVARLQNLTSISLPTDYPRPSGGQRLVEAAQLVELSEQTSLGLLKLALYNENFGEEDEELGLASGTSAFHLLLAAFAVLLHRYTGDTDLVIGSSSASARDPLVLRLSVDPSDPFWAVVRKVQQVEKEAEVVGRQREGERKRKAAAVNKSKGGSAREKELEGKAAEVRQRRTTVAEFLKEFVDG